MSAGRPVLSSKPASARVGAWSVYAPGATPHSRPQVGTSLSETVQVRDGAADAGAGGFAVLIPARVDIGSGAAGASSGVGGAGWVACAAGSPSDRQPSEAEPGSAS